MARSRALNASERAGRRAAEASAAFVEGADAEDGRCLMDPRRIPAEASSCGCGDVSELPFVNGSAGVTEMDIDLPCNGVASNESVGDFVSIDEAGDLDLVPNAGAEGGGVSMVLPAPTMPPPTVMERDPRECLRDKRGNGETVPPTNSDSDRRVRVLTELGVAALVADAGGDGEVGWADLVDVDRSDNNSPMLSSMLLLLADAFNDVEEWRLDPRRPGAAETERDEDREPRRMDPRFPPPLPPPRRLWP